MKYKEELALLSDVKDKLSERLSDIIIMKSTDLERTSISLAILNVDGAMAALCQDSIREYKRCQECLDAEVQI